MNGIIIAYFSIVLLFLKKIKIDTAFIIFILLLSGFIYYHYYLKKDNTDVVNIESKTTNNFYNYGNISKNYNKLNKDDINTLSEIKKKNIFIKYS